MSKKIKKEQQPFVIAKQAKLLYSVLLFGIVGMLFYGALILHDIYSTENELRMQISATKNIKQGDDIILKFSTAIDGRFDLSSVNIEPDLNIRPLWINNKELKIEIQGAPEINQEYTVSVNNIKTFWLNLKKNLVFNFQAASIPAVINVYPVNNQTEIDYDAKIKIDLNNPLSKQLFLEIDIDPDIDVEASLSENRTDIQIVPRNNLKKAQKYEISINVKNKLKEEFSENIYKGSFITKIPPRVIYSFDKSGEPRATDDLTWEIPAKISEGKYIDIDGSLTSLGNQIKENLNGHHKKQQPFTKSFNIFNSKMTSF